MSQPGQQQISAGAGEGAAVATAPAASSGSSLPPSRKNSGASGSGAPPPPTSASAQSTGSGAAQGEAAIPARDHAQAPLRKLTTGLLTTYKLINQRYYEAKKAKQAAKAASARVEDYSVTVGDVLGSHYRVEESMGKGSFGQVVSAIDTRTGVKVAVKVIKNKDAFRRQARTEIKLLELLNKKDPEDQWCIGELISECPPTNQPTPTIRWWLASARSWLSVK